MTERLSIRFEGAARTVTGSRHRIRLGHRFWLFDCGLHQGHRDEAEHLNRTFAFEPGDLESVVVSHAHLDHTGNLPTLVSQGYGGKIHATPATADLCRVMLPDSAFLMERDVDRVNGIPEIARPAASSTRPPTSRTPSRASWSILTPRRGLSFRASRCAPSTRATSSARPSPRSTSAAAAADSAWA